MSLFLRSLCLCLSFSIAPLSSSASPLAQFSDFLVFGDSESDPGNFFADEFGVDGNGVPISPVPGIYPNGQFTNGDTWATQLGADFVSGYNFSYGGATAALNGSFEVTLPDGSITVDVPDLPDQIINFQNALNSNSISIGPNPLAAIFLGGNDLRNAFRAADPVVAVQQAIISGVAAIASATNTLLNAGVSEVLVMGVPNLGGLPEIIARGEDSINAALGATLAFNSNLRTALATTVPTGVRFFDTFGLFEQVVANPADFGLTNVTDSCYSASILLGGDCSGFLFFDEIHPTEAGHAILAAAVEDSLAPTIPLPAGGLLLLSGLGGLLLMKRPRSARTVA